MIIVNGVISTGEGQPDPMDTKVSDIVRISVVKNHTELALYGPEGANGVILITTKRAKLN